MSNVRAVLGYEGLYSVALDGRIFSEPRMIMRSNGHPMTIQSRWRKQLVGPNGYWSVILCIDGVGERKMVHRILADAWLPGYRPGMHVNHINGIKTDNRIENLEWVTPSGNIKHAYRTGLRIPNRKFSDAQIVAIRNRIKTGECVRTIAASYAVSESAITKIKLGQTYHRTSQDLSLATSSNPVF